MMFSGCIGLVDGDDLAHDSGRSTPSNMALWQRRLSGVIGTPLDHGSQ